jgi:hypothetical protein
MAAWIIIIVLYTAIILAIGCLSAHRVGYREGFKNGEARQKSTFRQTCDNQFKAGKKIGYNKANDMWTIAIKELRENIECQNSKLHSKKPAN